jgi:hypothetical protein
VAFYTTLLGVGPAKLKPGYANFAVEDPALKLVLMENPGQGGTINHLGVEVDTSARVHAEIARFTEAGLFTDEEIGTTCCFATQDKVWVDGPDGAWEVYAVLEDSETFGQSQAQSDDRGVVAACCASEPAAETEPGAACCG